MLPPLKIGDGLMSREDWIGVAIAIAIAIGLMLASPYIEPALIAPQKSILVTQYIDGDATSWEATRGSVWSFGGVTYFRSAVTGRKVKLVGTVKVEGP